MLSLWLIFLLFTFTIFVCFLLIYSAYHITISAHFIVLLSLVLIPTTNVISKNHDFGVLTLLSFSSVSRVAILFLSFFSTIFAFNLIWLFLSSYAFLTLTMPDHVSPLLHMSLYFCICAELKQGIKSKLPSTSPFKSFLTCFTFDLFSPNYVVLAYVSYWIY